MIARIRSRERGMSLVEALVSVVLLSMVVIAFLQVFDVSAKVAKSQGNISDATENLRFSVAHLVRLTRMAGTGGIPICYPDGGGILQPLAVDSADNVSAGSLTLGGRTVLANSDVLYVRGVIESELYDIQGSAALTTGSGPGTLTVTATSPFSSVVYDLHAPPSPENYPVVIGLQTPLDIMPAVYGGVRHYSMYRVVHAAASNPVVINPGVDMTISYVVTGPDIVLNPGGAFQAFQTGFAYAAGFLDTYAYFVAANDAGEPSLYRTAGGGTAEELVPNIYTLQVAFGCDINRDAVIQGTEWYEDRDGTDSHPDGNQMATLREVRISVVARSQDPEPGWTTDVQIPENFPNSGQVPAADAGHRYRVITVRVALRSHPPLVDIT
jgi:hypothetical protein